MTTKLEQRIAKRFTEATGKCLEDYPKQCHAASLDLIRSGVLQEHFKKRCRVARGWCDGVPGQHSWVVVGDDCYARTAIIVDPTLWSYVDGVPCPWVGLRKRWKHNPHGYGSIWSWGKPESGDGPIISLDRSNLSRLAKDFLDIIGPLDRIGWARLLSKAPVEDWPSGEIIAAAYQDDSLRVLIPIDRVGMLTDFNPNNLYW